MDLLRTCYTARMAFDPNNPCKLTTVRWFFVERTDFVQNNAFVSSMYDPVQTGIGCPVGEDGLGFQTREGTIPAGAGIDLSPCGTAEQWAGEIAEDDANQCEQACIHRAFGSLGLNASLSWAVPCPLQVGGPPWAEAAKLTATFSDGSTADLLWYATDPSNQYLTFWYAPAPAAIFESFFGVPAPPGLSIVVPFFYAPYLDAPLLFQGPAFCYWGVWTPESNVLGFLRYLYCNLQLVSAGISYFTSAIPGADIPNDPMAVTISPLS